MGCVVIGINQYQNTRNRIRYAVICANVRCKNAYMLLEFQKVEKQMTGKPNLDYFRRI